MGCSLSFKITLVLSSLNSIGKTIGNQLFHHFSHAWLDVLPEWYAVCCTSFACIPNQHEFMKIACTRWLGINRLQAQMLRIFTKTRYNFPHLILRGRKPGWPFPEDAILIRLCVNVFSCKFVSLLSSIDIKVQRNKKAMNSANLFNFYVKNFSANFYIFVFLQNCLCSLLI